MSTLYFYRQFLYLSNYVVDFLYIFYTLILYLLTRHHSIAMVFSAKSISIATKGFTPTKILLSPVIGK